MPRSYDSGDDDGSDPHGRHVGHAGRRTLKWAWIEAAPGAVRSGGRFRAIFDRQSDGGKKNRGRAYNVELVRERASPTSLWSVLLRRTRKASDLFVSGPPAPDEIM